jgi:hypothetical protein
MLVFGDNYLINIPFSQYLLFSNLNRKRACHSCEGHCSGTDSTSISLPSMALSEVLSHFPELWCFRFQIQREFVDLLFALIDSFGKKGSGVIVNEVLRSGGTPCL